MRMDTEVRLRTRVCQAWVVVVMIVLAGCGDQRMNGVAAPLAHPTGAATPLPADTPAPTPLPVVPGTPLTWTHADLPEGFGLAFHQSDLAVQAGNGMVAYSCGQVAGDAHPAVIITRDRGASWTRMADIPVVWDGCGSIAVDQYDPAIAVAHEGLGSGGTPNAVTFDGGASWQIIADAQQDAIAQTATAGGRTFAILYAPQGSGVTGFLAYSDDHMRSWHTLLASTSSSDPIRDFWFNPANGSLLVRFYEDISYSDDGGQRWSPLKYPNPGVTGYIIQQPDTNQPWHVCAMVQGGALWISCSGDSGRTWHTLASMPGEELPNASYWFMGLAMDGAVLLRDNRIPFTLYQLSAGARQWQALGQAPARATGGITYFPTMQGGGTLWLFPAESDGAGAPDPATAVYSAAYGG